MEEGRGKREEGRWKREEGRVTLHRGGREGPLYKRAAYLRRFAAPP